MIDLKTDWDARPLPSAERCRRWFEQGGTWHTTSDAPVPAFYMSRGPRDRFPSMADQALWRPWKDGNPTLWAEFFTLTHPPIPEGYKPLGEWMQTSSGDFLPLLEDVAYQLEDGLVYEQINRVNPGEWYRVLEVLPKPVGWGDIPEGVTLRLYGGPIHEPFNSVDMNGKWIGTISQTKGKGFAAYDRRPDQVQGSLFPSFPAAVVALVRASEVKS